MSNAGFSDAQLSQIQMAENAEVDSIIKEHPEWSHILMNYCWNREKEGKDVSVVLEAGEYFAKYDMPQFSDNADIVYMVIDLLESGKTPVAPMMDKGVYDADMTIFKLAEQMYYAQGSKELKSGRMSISDVSFFYQNTIMAEGDREAATILHQLRAKAAQKAEHTADPWEAMNNRGWNMSSMILSLDDMNIRGKQIVYCRDYVDDNIQKLYDIISRRDLDAVRELIDYVNMRTARELLNNGMHGADYVAVSGGASFLYKTPDMMHNFAPYEDMELRMDVLNVHEFADKEVQPLITDFSKMDIDDSVSEDTAIRILKARGFGLISSVPAKNSSGEDAKAYIFYNPQTKDYVTADVAMPDNFCYGGCELNMHRTFDSAMSLFDMQCSHGGHEGQEGTYLQFTYHDGLFKHYDELKAYVPEKDYDWVKIGFGGYAECPIPQYFKMPSLRNEEIFKKLGNKTGALLCGDILGTYRLENFINATLLLYDGDIKQSASPHYQMYEDWYFENASKEILSIHDADDWREMDIASIVLTYLEVPDDFVQRLIDGICTCFQKMDENPDIIKNDRLEHFDEVRQSITNHYSAEAIKKMENSGFFAGLDELKKGLPWKEQEMEDREL